MTIYELERALWVPRPLTEVFNFFSRAENLEQITPPFLQFRITTKAPLEMKEGAAISYALRVRGLPVRWLTHIERWNPPFEFVDVQSKGPYKLWRHTHQFAAVDGGTSITDNVQYALPFGALGRIVHRLRVRRDLATIFDYRAERIRELFR
jgi:ligand-binding SRPBCC domain-containing protein